MEWIKYCHKLIETKANNIIDPLLQLSGKRIRTLGTKAANMYRETLEDSARLLHTLRIIVGALSTRTAMEDDFKALYALYLSITNSIEYLRVAEWCLGNGLLPVASGLYDYTKMKEAWVRRNQNRVIAPKLVSVSPDMVPKTEKSDFEPFVIKMLRQAKLSTDHYPPQSLAELLTAFREGSGENQAIMYKHLAMFYFLVDFQRTLDTVKVDVLTLYARQFRITNGWQQLVFGFWLLDTHLHDPQLLDQFLSYYCSSEIPSHPWTDEVIEALVCSNANSAARRVLNVYGCKSLVLHMNVLLSNGLLSSAFKLEREAPDNERRRMLWYCILEYAISSGSMPEVFGLPLDEFEDKCLIDFLCSSEHSNADDLLLGYYILKSRYVEAIYHARKLRDTDPESHNIRNSIIENVLVRKINCTLLIV